MNDLSTNQRLLKLERRVAELERLIGIQDQTQLFPTPAVSAYRDSGIPEQIREIMKAEIEAGIDIDYYNNLVLEWSDNLPIRTKTQRDKALRSAQSWVSTFKGFLRRDHKSNKLKMIKLNTENQLNIDQSEADYIRQMSGSWN